ncbi:hypothetical protein B0H67DRAFT_8174 [Lasiosphaeris hirsuta]|uniref:Uncharacterized protein n=1 Tax=Lasiosphaeris hirsuta TaxID=260670 RepID=A0AA40B8T4_9PEZI|nr:hypothetical protein B0H67DRAFT_8174 [Lasiosphaeris hirsuta]
MRRSEHILLSDMSNSNKTGTRMIPLFEQTVVCLCFPSMFLVRRIGQKRGKGTTQAGPMLFILLFAFYQYSITSPHSWVQTGSLFLLSSKYCLFSFVRYEREIDRISRTGRRRNGEKGGGGIGCIN